MSSLRPSTHLGGPERPGPAPPRLVRGSASSRVPVALASCVLVTYLHATRCSSPPRA